jgi:hypothetical protein
LPRSKTTPAFAWIKEVGTVARLISDKYEDYKAEANNRFD